MSLLIKALDSAEKTKQAEKYKKQTAENAAAPVVTTATPMALELEPLSTAASVPEQTSSTQLAPELANEQTSTLTTQDSQKPANSLTLAEEAGLPEAPISVKKYAKSKPDVVQPQVASTPLKGSPRDNQIPAPLQVKQQTTSAPAAATSNFQANPTSVDANQKTAAKTFVANQAAKPPGSKYALLTLGVAGALIIWLGLQGYTYIKPLLSPQETVTPTPPLPVTPEQINIEPVVPGAEPIPATELQAQSASTPEATDFEEKQLVENAISNEKNPLPTTTVPAVPTQAFSEKGKIIPPLGAVESTVISPNESVIDIPKDNARKKSSTNAEVVNREPLKLTSKKALPVVDPNLLTAYKAFTRGEDSLAQQQYRIVLQKDLGNVDALLGMAAIAQRQGRDADAAGWFQRVLEIEPRNAIALTAIVNNRGGDPVSSESRLKNMLALQPDGADLHAALGNLYAEQNQWARAQEAYFNASRYAPNNPDYVFNLAISLDQLGKTDLALKQYQRALAIVNQTGAISPDRSQLEARIQALQQQ